MATASNSFQAIMTGTPEERVEALRQYLSYPIKERDPEKDQFWYLRPGTDEEMARETQPIAVGFYEKLNEGSDTEIKAWVVSKENAVSDHFFDWGDFTNQPAMYLLLPEAEQAGRVVLVLPSESRQWRQRQVLTYKWNEKALQTPLGRLKQGELELMQKVEDKPMFSVPLVEWAFYKPIATAKELAQELARVSRDMEQIIAGYKESTLNEYLRDLFNSFKRELLPNLKVSSANAKDYSFADIYAQTIAYGLFTARVFSHVRNPGEDFNRQNVWDKLPETNPFLRQLFQGISEQLVESLGDDLADKISEVFSILRAAKMDAILSDFRQKMNREDIVIRFYEDFLAAYKPEMRERRGVYYTPEPVVSYMVRSVDILLKEKFDKSLGLADPEVMILDPACGTGTFLLSIFQLIHQRFEENPEALTNGLEDKSWSGYVQERLLPRVFGFELLMAPYAIAHLKLGLFLEDTGYQFNSGKRLGIYLINTLDDPSSKENREQMTLDIPQMEEAIATESLEGIKVKNHEPIMVVIGNPPYSGHSENNNSWIKNLVNDYKYCNGEKVEIRQGKWLQNDYIKFIRFSEWRICKSKKGISCFITDHSYLDGGTFIGLRNHLMSSFDESYVVNLHGNINKSERCPDGTQDENVFDISQGVAIQMLVSDPGISREGGSLHSSNYFDLYGIREGKSSKSLAYPTGKYDWLSQNDVLTTQWEKCIPSRPLFLFSGNLDRELSSEYSSFHCLSEIFSPYGKPAPGIVTTHDEFAISWSKMESLEKVRFLLSTSSEEEARQRFRLCSQSQWNYEKAKLALDKIDLVKKVVPIAYRPFDNRFTIYDSNVAVHLRERLSKHFIDFENIGLCVSRQINGKFTHAFCSKFIINDCTLSNATRERSYMFPLYIAPDGMKIKEIASRVSPNISVKFMNKMNGLYGDLFSPKSLFSYAYSILHSPTYRTRYADFLKIDFPRIPLTINPDLFQYLSTCGESLINLHMMKSTNLRNLITKFGGSDRTVDPGHPKYANGKVTINKRGTGFTGVPQEVWEFYIGGYQVCHKWLKDRKGRTLSDDDILHYQKIIVALQETIRIMQQIDDAIPSWPIE